MGIASDFVNTGRGSVKSQTVVKCDGLTAKIPVAVRGKKDAAALTTAIASVPDATVRVQCPKVDLGSDTSFRGTESYAPALFAEIVGAQLAGRAVAYTDESGTTAPEAPPSALVIVPNGDAPPAPPTAEPTEPAKRGRRS